MTLTEFLLARIAEDESVIGGPDPDWKPYYEDSRNGLDCTHDGLIVWSGRMLAECEAKRRIVERHIAVDGRCPCGVETVAPFLGGLLVTTCPELRYIAGVYADHPDYRDEWRP